MFSNFPTKALMKVHTTVEFTLGSQSPSVIVGPTFCYLYLQENISRIFLLNRIIILIFMLIFFLLFLDSTSAGTINRQTDYYREMFKDFQINSTHKWSNICTLYSYIFVQSLNLKSKQTVNNLDTFYPSKFNWKRFTRYFSAKCQI